MPETNRFDDTMQMEYNTQDPDLSGIESPSADMIESKEEPKSNFGGLPALSLGVLTGVILSSLIIPRL